MRVIFLGRIAWIFVAIATFFLGTNYPVLTLTVFFFGFAIFTFTDGCSGVPWMDLVGKMIPPLRRGRFHGLVQFLGGALALLGGFMVQFILARYAFPTNYALIFLLAGIILLAAVATQIPIKERKLERLGKRYPLRSLFKSVPLIIKKDKTFARYILVQMLMGCYMLAFPFYAIYANSRLGLGEAVVGYFVVAQMAGGIIASLIWAYISDNKSNLLLIRIVGIFYIIIPLLALVTPLLPLSSGLVLPVYLLVFVLLGSNMKGMWIGFTNYLMEIVDEGTRPVYFGLMNTINFPLVLIPFLGGYIIGFLSFNWLFIITALLMTLSLALTWLMPEPREQVEGSGFAKAARERVEG
ncbi:MAG: MFS transporter, partial [Halanaerobium sp.]|nr:MFS transporter [Halanaerobium sp.]